MQINYTASAFASLASLINFVEDRNTKDAGIRWLQRYEFFLEKALAKAEHIRLCNNETLKKLSLRCIYYNDWIIAFSIQKGVILIEALLHKSRIID